MTILLTHGSSDDQHAEQAKQLATQVSQLTQTKVSSAFLSDTCLSQGAKVMPMFLGQGSHLKTDVPQLIAQSHAEQMPALVEHAESLASFIVQGLQVESKRIHVLFVVYQFEGFEKLVSALYRQAKSCSLVAMASLHGYPNVQSVMHSLEKQGIKKLIVQPVFLLGGHSLNECKRYAQSDKIEIEIKSALVDIDGFDVWLSNILAQPTI